MLAAWYIRHPELVDTAAEDADDEADELNDDDYEPVVDGGYI